MDMKRNEKRWSSCTVGLYSENYVILINVTYRMAILLYSQVMVGKSDSSVILQTNIVWILLSNCIKPVRKCFYINLNFTNMYKTWCFDWFRLFALLHIFHFCRKNNNEKILCMRVFCARKNLSHSDRIVCVYGWSIFNINEFMSISHNKIFPSEVL